MIGDRPVEEQSQIETNYIKNRWVLDVLIDLISYAQLNDLPILASQLERVASENASELMD